MRKSGQCSADGALHAVLLALAALTTVTTVMLTMRHVSAGAAEASRAEIARVRRLASRAVEAGEIAAGWQPQHGLPASIGAAGAGGAKAVQIRLRHGDATSVVRVGPLSSESAVREAVAASLDIDASAQWQLVGADGAFAAVSASALADGATYTVRVAGAASAHGPPLSPGAAEPASAEASELRAELAKVRGELDRLRSTCRRDSHSPSGSNGGGGGGGGPVLSGKPASLPRVVLASLGTGRYRGIAIAALESAAEHFGGDCEVSLHVLTDDVDNVDPRFNPAHAPYREWPESGLSKFEDILNALRPVIQSADYFYFMDGDVRFHEDVRLADVAGDLVGVEHPFYPRNILGFCKPDAPPRDRGFCGYPYDRNPKSQIGIPEDQGRSFIKVEDKKRGPYWVVRSNAWYLQSAFWGGKSKPILGLLTDLKQRVDVDRSHGVYSQVVQDERYVNFYFWKHANDSDIVLRILPPSYLYPYNPSGFGDWILNHSRPIIVHGTAKPGKMIKGEAEFRVRGTTQCLDIGAAPAKDQIGVYGCHEAAHRGGSQGFIWLGGLMRVAYGKSDKPGDKTCVDGEGVAPGEPLVSRKCVDGADGQQWRHDNATGLLSNVKTGLCVDTMRLDAEAYPDAAKSKQAFVSVQPCGKSAKQAFDITLVSLEESVKAVEAGRRHRRGRGA